MMLDYLVDDNHIDLPPDTLRLVKDLISGTPRSQRYGASLSIAHVVLLTTVSQSRR